METIELILGDSSSIWEFSSKSIPVLDNTWEGSWTISTTLGGTPIIEGDLIKNIDILNKDSLVGEDFRKTYKIFEPEGTEVVLFNDDVIMDSLATISGLIVTQSIVDGVTVNTPIANKYIYVTIKGVFVPYTRDVRLKTNTLGEFSYDFNLSDTVKTKANSFFIFQIMPWQSEQLSVQNYFLTVEVRQHDTLSNLIFRKEVLQSKLKIVAQGVL